MLKRIVIITAVIEQTTGCLKNRLHGWAERVVVNGSHSTWGQMKFLRGLLRGLLLMINTFISDLEDMMQCTLSEFGDEARLRGPLNVLEGRVAIQRDPDQH